MNEKLQKYIENKKYDLALQFIHKIQKKDYSLEYHNYKIVVYLLSQKYDAALLELTALLLKYPDDPTFLCNMGLAHKGKKNFVEAANFLNKSLEIDSENLNSYLNLTEVYIESFDYAKAIELLKIILQKNNRLERCYQLLAFCYREINFFEEAHKNLEFSIQLNPFNYENFYHLGFSYIWRKDFTNATNSFEKCFALNKNYIPALYQLNNLSKFNINSENFNYLISLKDNHLGKHNAAYKYLTLSEIYYHKNEYNQFFSYLKKANQLKNSDINYKLLNNELIKKNYDQLPIFEQTKLNFTPIFIIGMPRSGSSLIEQVLSQSSDVYAAGEIPILHEMLNFQFNDNSSEIDSDKLNSIKNTYLNYLALLPKTKYLIDKLPLNFYWIGFIKSIFPNAIFIHSHRKKVDVCMSLYKTFFADGVLEFSYSQKNIVDFYSQYEDMVSFWKHRKVELINIKYEDIIDNPTLHFEHLFNILNLKFSDSFLNLESNKRPVKTASFIQITNKLERIKYPDWTLYSKEIPLFLKD
jgi:tetratricopeptide (TPR) repeat protein